MEHPEVASLTSHSRGDGYVSLMLLKWTLQEMFSLFYQLLQNKTEVCEWLITTQMGHLSEKYNQPLETLWQHN